jgi:hypothetical protein
MKKGTPLLYSPFQKLPKAAYGHDRPLADLPQSSLSGTVGVCFDPILRRAAFHDFLMVYGNGKYTTESLMEQGFDCDSRCRVREQASELGRKTVSPYQS